ncbi:MAG TPA: hypothetical protein VK879_20555, partial [Candidatus Sulfomarinibacteraceae bacterium]|nr:hypothetical protein [Candidatus Sulfomarinibacteraceae bacterium]
MRKRLWRYLWLIVVLAPLAGCDVASLLGPGVGPGRGAQQQTLLVETVVVPGTDECYVVVTVNRPAQNVDLDLQVAFEAGIRSAVTGEHISEVKPAKVMVEELVARRFECVLAPSEIEVSGAYVVRAMAFHRSTRQPFEAASTVLHVYADNAGRRQFMDGEAFAQLYGAGFVPGTGPIRYRVALDEAPYPDHGVFYLRVDSGFDGFAPTLDLLVGDGLHLVDGGEASLPLRLVSERMARASLGAIAAGGSRVLTVPFRLAPGSAMGEYSLQVALNGRQWAEVAPVFVAVKSDLNHAQSAWLDQVQRRATELSSGPGWQMGSSGDGQPALPAAPTATAPPPAVPQEQASIVWDQQLTGYQGDRRRLWQQLSARVPMSWEQFNAEIVRHNPHLAIEADRTRDRERGGLEAAGEFVFDDVHGDQSFADGEDGGLDAGLDAQFVENMVDVGA